MIESMACGTPVVTTAHGSAPELIGPGMTGHAAVDQRAINGTDGSPPLDSDDSIGLAG